MQCASVGIRGKKRLLTSESVAPAPARAADHGLVRTIFAALLLLSILPDAKKWTLSVSNVYSWYTGYGLFSIVVHTSNYSARRCSNSYV